MGGDCNTVSAIVGQISGAIEGFNYDIFNFYRETNDFTNEKFDIFLHAIKLIKKNKCTYPTAE